MPGQRLDERTRTLLAQVRGHKLKSFYTLLLLVNERFSCLEFTEDFLLIVWFKRLHLAPGLAAPSRSLSNYGALPLRRRMDDEEEDMSRPISQLWGTPFRDVKYEETTAMAAGQAFDTVTVALPTSHNNNSISINALPCSLHWQPRIPFHGNAGLRAHFPAQFEPMEDRGQRQIEEEEEEEGREEEDNSSEQRNQEQEPVSAEAQIGRKLREIGDKFHQDHFDQFMRHQRQNLPVWMRLTIAMFGFLFPREPLLPRLRGQQR